MMDKKKLAIAIPASTISDTPHLREKTSKIGLIGRAAAIFRVDEIIVYLDNPKTNQIRDLEFIALLLNYLRHHSTFVKGSLNLSQTCSSREFCLRCERLIILLAAKLEI